MPTWTSSTRTPIHYRDIGRGLPVVLLHAFPLSGEMFESQWKDGLTPPARARAIADLVPGAELVELPGAGHLSNLEAPEAFNAALARFLDRLPAGG